jgi:hypothetical protein
MMTHTTAADARHCATDLAPDLSTASAPNDSVQPADRRLATTLAAEDLAEWEGGLSPHDRITCRLHRRWAYQCISSPRHIIAVTGHRWCDDCATGLTVLVDELTRRVELTCPCCHQTPNTRATEQIIRTCEASLHAAHRRVSSTRRTSWPTEKFGQTA